MSNAIYDLARKSFLDKQIDMLNDTIKVALVKSSYTPATTTDQFYDPAITAHVHATPVALSSKTTTAGVFDAADITFTAPVAAAVINYLVIYSDSGTATTSRLIAVLDTSTGLPLTTNGADVIVTWDNGSNKIFKL